VLVPLLAAAALATCAPTPADALGPFYEPSAPVRSKVGSGYVLTGAVRSARTCKPIPRARVELWLAGPDGEYADRYRATIFASRTGTYRFESHFPPPYSGRPSHIHIRVTARGFRTLVTQHYPRAGTRRASFALVLRPR
jgi:protocatechuate 3,4-dioxygenase beta subunit